MTPTLFTLCTFGGTLPLSLSSGANFSRGGPSKNCYEHFCWAKLDD